MKRFLSSLVDAAHPRSHGENYSASARIATRLGSSPLTRGKLRLVHWPTRQLRLIPAHAGKTCGPPRPGPSAPAHPRSRGENSFSIPYRADMAGSSPLTRGKLSSCVRVQADPGLIPAHAGKTLIPALAGVLAGAHPRSRGENDDIRRTPAPVKGSSPLTRGKRVAGRPQLRADRLIPAHAGKT